MAGWLSRRGRDNADVVPSQNITSIGRREQKMGVSVTFRARGDKGKPLTLAVLRDLVGECDSQGVEDTAVLEVFFEGSLIQVDEVAVTDSIK